MIDWETVRPALAVLLRELTHADAGQRVPVVWEDQARPFVPPGVRALVLLHVGPTVGHGVDYRAQESDAEGIEETIQGTRRCRVRCKVEALEQTHAAFAASVTERIRTRLRRTSSGETLRAVNCALAYVGDSTDYSEKRDGRIVSIIAFDLVLTIAVGDTDGERSTWVQSVEVGGTVDGTTAPTQTITYPEDEQP